MNTQKKIRRMARPTVKPDAANSSTEAATGTPQAVVAADIRPTKQSLVLDLLRHDGGASLAALAEATGWLPHTTRAALTGLRKKGHPIIRSKVDNETRYMLAAVPVE